MSQRDLVAELRAAHVGAPSEVRERVRLIAAGAPAPPRRITWRRALVVAVPLAAAVAATLVVTRPAHHDQTTIGLARRGPITLAPSAAAPAHTPSAKVQAFSVPAAKGRVQQYDATLSLRVEHARDVSDGVKRALRITTSLGGYSQSVHAETHGGGAVADLKLRIPRSRVQEAMASLAQIGTITDENVSTVDETALLNSTDRQIARLQKQLAVLRTKPQTVDNDRHIASLTARIERLQRGEATTRRNAHYATVNLHLEKPLVTIAPKKGHGPLHGVGVALEWLGIGAVYALAVGAPVLVLFALVWLGVRLMRRRRENALLEL